ncbi:MAG: Rieske 2Fe-2S domain-containing protein [Opitutaceae bacterium]
MNRKQFLVLAAALVAGCHTVNLGGRSGSPPKERLVDAGPVGNFAADGLYSAFLDQGFFVIRQGSRLFVLSSLCTHRKCKLNAMPDRSFYCDCHGSTFDPNGRVTEGPATRNLPTLPFTYENGRLLVRVPAG